MYLRSLFPPLLMTSPSFNHWTVGVGVPWTRQTSWMLSFSRTPISLGSSDPEILGGTKRELLVLAGVGRMEVTYKLDMVTVI